jgi:hypothetical protein
MSSDKPKKPFLADADLGAELDAWDNMFDALHEAGEEPPAAAPEVMAWPQPAAQEASPVPEPELSAPDLSSTLDDLDAQMTLDNAVSDDEGGDETRLDIQRHPSESANDLYAGGPPARPSAPPFAATWEAPASETDFSDVGTEGKPAALGSMLGSPRAQSSAAFEDDDEVYTSASRPNSSVGGGVPLPEDPVAPPPTPASQPVRRTAAIIRRTPEGVPVAKPPPSYSPASDEASPFAESTRVADISEIERGAAQSRGDRSKAPTAPPPMSFSPAMGAAEPVHHDDEYEIEIGADAGGDAAAPAPEPTTPAPRRTVAHVVRRTEALKAVIPAPEERRSEPVIEMTMGDEPASEDDFSDVAAAVGASDDLAIPGAMDLEPPVVPAEEHIIEAEDDAQIDDHAATRLHDDSDDELGGGDAYVALNPQLDVAVTPPPREALRRPHDDDDEPEFETRLMQHGPATISDRPPAIVDLYPQRVKTPTSVPPMVRTPVRVATALTEDVHEVEPLIDLETLQLPEQVQPLPSSALDDDAIASLAIYEREIATVDDATQSAALRVEAGRLCERLGDLDRARTHYDAALLADPRATSALRGLRRIARTASDLGEATRQLDAELAVAGALERRPLAHYRVDLLLAGGEQDLARVAVGELLDSAPSDVRALLAQLELAFLDGRAEEFGNALEQLAHAVTDSELRAAVQSARGVLAAQHEDADGAASWFAAASDSDPASLSARLGVLRQHVRSSNAAGAAGSLLDLARQLGDADPTTTAALALRAQHWATGEVAAAAAQVATDALPADPLVARIAAETAVAGQDPAAAAAALSAWASCPASPAERAYGAARAAELDPAHAADLWSTALRYDPGDDYGAAQLRTAHVASEQTQLAIEVDLAVAADVERDRARLRAAFGMVAQGQLDAAIELLQTSRTARPEALAIAEALAEAYAAAGKWSDRARLLGELAASPTDQLDKDVAQLRSALAWEEAVGAASESGDNDEVQRTTAAALEAWGKVLERDPSSPTAHAAAIVLATRLGDRDVLGETYARAQEAERSRWTAATIALRRARLVADDPARVDPILDESNPGLDDPRKTLALMLAAVRRNDLGSAASALEERANTLSGSEAAVLRLRAAQIALDGGDAARATTILAQVERALPQLGIVRDLLSAARRRAGDRDRSGPIARVPEGADAQTSGDAFARLVRDADAAAAANDGSTALALYQRALELRPGDPLAAVPLVRVAMNLREPAPIAALALAQLRAAEASGDGAAKAEAYELLAQLDKELRGDPGAAQVALESASQADPTRIDLMHRLEREYTVTDQLAELMRLRRAELEQVPAELAKDRAAMVMDVASLSDRDQRPDAELAELYRAALVADPHRRIALLQLESIVRRAGASEELARLEGQIAEYFEGDARTQASFYTRSGETLTELGQIDAAVQRFGKADSVMPGHVPALEAWRSAALKGQLWLDASEAATREANGADVDAETKARLHHFAGVVQMDKALIGEKAMASFHKALEAEPGHKDSFLRLRILLEEDARQDELAILLENRLDYEQDEKTRVELHRAVAKLLRDFLGDRDKAKVHYRAILEADPNDLRALAAVADISWEQGAWQDAADALINRAKLERDAETLKTLCFRLGLIYADRLVDVPMAIKAFQRALTYNPDDEATLVRLADLATQAGEWKLALGACERLVKAEQDGDKRASHLHRVARIFRMGFGDMKRAERALNLALDGAPTNDEALSELVRFYREAGDMTSVRVHLNRVAGTMRNRAAQEPKDGVAYRVIARAMAARASAGVDGSMAIARCGAELATLLGAGGDPERMILQERSRRVELSHLLRPEADEVIFPRSIQPELRQLFTLLGDRIAKHVGVDLRAHGVGRGDRLRAKDSAVAAHAQEVATGFGFGDIDVYVSAREPFAMLAEPTSPVSLVIGQAIAQGDARGVRFAAGAALKLAQTSLAIPARLPPDELGVLTVALVRLFQPEFPLRGLDEGAVSGQMQKLKRLIPTGLNSELKPYGLAIDAGSFDHRAIARDLRIAGLRAGLVAAGSLLAGLNVLAAQSKTDVPSFLADPVAQGLLTFALAEDHATVAR